MPWNTADFPEDSNLMLCQYLESEWSDSGNRFKKCKVTNTS